MQVAEIKKLIVDEINNSIDDEPNNNIADFAGVENTSVQDMSDDNTVMIDEPTNDT